MPRALVLSLSDPNRDPRPRRALGWLSVNFSLAVAAFAEPDFIDCKFYDLSGHGKTMLGGMLGFIRRAAGLKLNSMLGRNDESEWPPSLLACWRRLEAEFFDLVLCFDAELLPLADALRGRGKLVFDAREYYPAQFDDRPVWRLCLQDFAAHLCRKYLPRCDAVITVSEGLKEGYRCNFGVDSEVLYSLPEYRELSPSRVDPNRIKLIYHGNANPSRATHHMVDLAKALEPRFRMDFMVLPTASRYVSKLRSAARDCSRIGFIEPQPFNEIVPFLNQYDLGVFYVPPNNFNLEHCMPNKLFEFIQARLGVVVGPSPDMRAFVDEMGVGLAGQTWDVRELARRVNALDSSAIAGFKAASHSLAERFSARASAVQFDRILKRLFRFES